MDQIFMRTHLFFLGSKLMRIFFYLFYFLLSINEVHSNDTNVFYPFTAKELVFDGINQPSGYTEPILHKRRLEFKLKHN